MNRLGWVLAVAACAIIFPRTSGACDDRKSRTFASLAEEYYRRYYALAQAEALVPGEELSRDAKSSLDARLRRKSLEWSQALKEELRLDPDGSFTFHARAIEPPDKGISWLTAAPGGPRVKKRGSWSLQSSDLTLRVEEVNGAILPVAELWQGVLTGGELVMVPWRDGLGTSVLVEMSAPQPSWPSCTWAVNLSREVRGQLSALQTAIAALGARLSRAGPPSDAARSPGSASREISEWLEALRSRDDRKRLSALMELVQRECREIVPELIRISAEPESSDVRLVAVDTLGRWRCVEAVPALIGALADREETIRAVVDAALRTIVGSAGELDGPAAEGPGDLQQRWRIWWERNRERIAKERAAGR